jgi:hypothetical protein
MTVRCPNGHESSTDDFCDVCGEPIATSTASAASPASPAATAAPPSSLTLPEPPAKAATAVPGTTQRCPNCGDENTPDALFCEECGYDFTTGQMPAAAAPPPEGAPAAPPPVADWVAEVWIDPDWFAAQEAEGGCATSGPPDVVPIRGGAALIGRRSRTRSITPDIDCTGDGAVSHRHAQLTRDHDRWFVEDLGSANGTYVGTPGDALPSTPLTPHQRHELDDGDRIYCGAWTRIVVRRATDAEKMTTP